MYKCIDSCFKDDIYIYEYNNSCYEYCPNRTKQIENEYKCLEYKNIGTTIISDTSEILILNMSTYITAFKDERDKEIDNFRETISDFNISENTEDIITMKDNVS